jgi:cytochrome oxidase Cu insertion factor (SCO1/SenC/PrrC family)
MITRTLSVLLVLMTVGFAAAQSKSIPGSQSASKPPVQAPPVVPHTNLKVGDKAPDFTLRATDGKTYKLSDFRGQKNVVLAIYVLAFTGG